MSTVDPRKRDGPTTSYATGAGATSDHAADTMLTLHDVAPDLAWKSIFNPRHRLRCLTASVG
jgi:hypothetical protein